MPIPMMFAADLGGRSYREYATDHRTLVECQLRVAEAFDADHVSCISDPALCRQLQRLLCVAEHEDDWGVPAQWE